MGRLDGQTVVVLGGSAGMGLETARLARASGAEVAITGRNEERLKQAAAAVDATNPALVNKFVTEFSGQIDHVFVTAGGPYYGLLKDLDLEDAQKQIG